MAPVDYPPWYNVKLMLCEETLTARYYDTGGILSAKLVDWLIQHVKGVYIWDIKGGQLIMRFRRPADAIKLKMVWSEWAIS